MLFFLTQNLAAVGNRSIGPRPRLSVDGISVLAHYFLDFLFIEFFSEI